MKEDTRRVLDGIEGKWKGLLLDLWIYGRVHVVSSAIRVLDFCFQSIYRILGEKLAFDNDFCLNRFRDSFFSNQRLKTIRV